MPDVFKSEPHTEKRPRCDTRQLIPFSFQEDCLTIFTEVHTVISYPNSRD